LSLPLLVSQVVLLTLLSGNMAVVAAVAAWVVAILGKCATVSVAWLLCRNWIFSVMQICCRWLDSCLQILLAEQQTLLVANYCTILCWNQESGIALVSCLNSTDKGWSSIPSVLTTSFFPGCLHFSLHHNILTGAMHVNLAFQVEKSLLSIAAWSVCVVYQVAW